MDPQSEAPEEVPEVQSASTTNIGYGNPPRSTRFQKGRSGNPKGRPKSIPNSAMVFKAELKNKVVVNECGKRKTITKFEAAMKQLINQAASGNQSAIKQLSWWIRYYDEFDAALPHQSFEPTSADVHQQLTERLRARIAERRGRKPDPSCSAYPNAGLNGGGADQP